jgi:CTP:molybdopterin cytidylyltransferase MocA
MVVLGSNADEILPHVPPSAQVIVNKQWRNGQLSSLQAALRKISTDAAFLIYPVDHPLLPGKTFQQLVRAFRARRPSQEIVMPRYRGTDGHPVIVSPALRPEFFKARTAREVIYRIPERIHPVEVKTTAILQDFNSPETYLSCRRKWRNVRSR